MKQIFYNYDMLTENDINNVVSRVKVLLINSKREVLLGFEHNTFQFPGGHVEENETLGDCIVREIKEETGIELENVERKPFFVIKYFNKDYPEVGLNSCFLINYYIIETDEPFNLNNINLTENEKDGNFELKYIPLEKIEETLTESIEWNKKNKIIVPEMLEVFTEYKKITAN